MLQNYIRARAYEYKFKCQKQSGNWRILMKQKYQKYMLNSEAQVSNIVKEYIRASAYEYKSNTNESGNWWIRKAKS